MISDISSKYIVMLHNSTEADSWLADMEKE